MKTKLLAVSITMILTLICFSSCSDSNEDTFAVKELNESYESMGLTVKEMTEVDDEINRFNGYSSQGGIDALYDIVVTGDLSEKELKELFKDKYDSPNGEASKDGSLEDPLGDRFFGPWHFGFGDSDYQIGIRSVTINGIAYSRVIDSFAVDELYWANFIKANDEIFLKDKYYDKYAKLLEEFYAEQEEYFEEKEKEQKAKEAEKKSNSDNSSSEGAKPTNYAICYYIIDMYHYYEKNGGYDGDDYTDDAWRDAERRFKMSESEIEAAWTDYDANMKAMKDYNAVHD